MSQVRYAAEFKADIVARFKASENKRQFAKEAGITRSSLWAWARGNQPKIAHNPVSGRVHEFRMVGEELQFISLTGRWEPYVSFREVRETLARLVEEAPPTPPARPPTPLPQPAPPPQPAWRLKPTIQQRYGAEVAAQMRERALLRQQLATR